MILLLTKALALLRRKQPLIEATVIRQQGSTPRAAGAKMFIGADGFQEGTVGGGLLEGDVVRAARTALQTGRSRILNFDLTGTDAAAQGMICGGRTQVLLEFLPADGHVEMLFNLRLQALESKQPVFYLTVLPDRLDVALDHRETGGDAVAGLASIDHCLVPADSLSSASCNLPPGVREQLQGLRPGGELRLIAADRCTVVIETLARSHTAFFFGAGHVVLHAARFAAQVGFGVVVIDDRAAFANSDRFPHPAEARVVSNFEHALTDLDIDPNAFLIIATRGHIHDRSVLRQTLQTDAAYIGMIGSRSKKETIYASLSAEGIAAQDLGRVHCPIGLPIGAETPEEIGISIVAEMIQERRKLGR